MGITQIDWYVYILQCKNTHYYTGVTTDISARFEKHLSGKGAKYTRANPPEKIVYEQKMKSEGQAKKREAEIKRMNRIEKKSLIQAHSRTDVTR